MNDLDKFLDPVEPAVPEETEARELGLTIADPQTVTQKGFNESIMRVFNSLGGDAWLLAQAQLYPKEFLAMLKPLIQKEDPNAALQGIHITVNGENVNIEGRSYQELGVVSNGLDGAGNVVDAEFTIQ